MRDKIREMVLASTQTNRLESSEGTTVVISTPSLEQISRGASSYPHTVVFACNEDARLFYHAGPVILAMCAELDQAELNQRPGVVEELQSQVQTAKNERDVARAEIARLMDLISKLLEREEKLSELAKFGRTLQPKYVALFDRARALQAALDAARARAIALEAEIEDRPRT